MAQTRAQLRAQEDANRRRNSDDQDQDSPPRKRQRRTTHPTPSKKAQGKDRKRAIEDATHATPSSKRRKTSIPSAEDTFAEATGHRDPNHPISFWAREGVWPRHLLEFDMNDMYEADLARRRSFPSFGRKRSNSALSTPTPLTTPSEVKAAQYRDPRYKPLLKTMGVFMDAESDHGITVESKTCYMALLTSEQTIPTDSLFRDDLFEKTCRNVADRNEARVVRDISPLLVPPAEVLATYGSAGLECLVESINEPWSSSIPLTGIPRPQPDYSVGFRQEAFTNDQLSKLKLFVGDPLVGDQSFFMATKYMYFPFLTCEAKCGLRSSDLDVADCQNAHSMALAVRGIVKLFRNVGREKEVHRQILSFSVSHDHDFVRIYGYYPVVIDKQNTKYYRHPIYKFSFTTMDGKEKWTAYRFVKNIYDKWMPNHFKSICSAIDQLPDLDLDVQPLSSKSNGLSQDLGIQVELSEADSESLVRVRMDKDTMPAPTRTKRRKEASG
ncbi:hypothetical protein QBC45DRAFT_433355 [Copromyces sp. CBS 386.78]|nr:hypothetical protein QBC45DRAFT_433355 [Copromyces sp. CBS 386.78]